MTRDDLSLAPLPRCAPAVTSLPLKLLPEPLAIARLPPDADVPAWALRGSFVSTIRTAAELSVVAPASAVPANAKAERGWRALQVDGTLDFGLTGILAALAVPLADAGIPIFALSTYDTDYLLVRETQLPAARRALRAAGHTVS